ncbi:MAG: sulfotransferase family protein [Acidimicrobiales bacterium]
MTRAAPTDFDPVFVVGSPRSGTGWTRQILAQHDRVVSGPESHLFGTVYRPIRSQGLTPHGKKEVIENYDRSSTSNTGPHWWIERDHLIEILESVGDTHTDARGQARTVIDQVFRQSIRHLGGTQTSCLVEKTPHHVAYAEVILDLWPAARVVEVVRDGRDVVASMANRSRTTEWAPAERQQQIQRWVEMIAEGDRSRALSSARGRWLRVHYEDLSRDRCGSVTNLYDFVGLDHNTDLVAEVAMAVDFTQLPAKATGPGRHRFRGEVGGWSADFDAADIELFECLAGDTLRGLGYT